MEILIIDNISKTISEIKRKINKFSKTKIINFQKIPNNYNKYDAIVLSGGQKYAVHINPEAYEKELELIKNFNKPILGICLGFQLINYAFGEKLKKFEKKRIGEFQIKIISKNKIFNSMTKTLKVSESHRWFVEKTNFLKTIATSEKCIEAVKHPNKEIYGVQFHPESNKTYNQAGRIFDNFKNIINKQI